jgi:hypothetical protein
VSTPAKLAHRDLEAVIWSIADGRSSDDEIAALHADERASLVVIDTLLRDTEDALDSVRNLTGDEREQVVADLTDTLQSLQDVAARLRPPPTPPPTRAADAAEPPVEAAPGEVELHASWSSGRIVVWAGGRGRTPETHDQISARLEAIGAAPVGWQPHPGVRLPGGTTAAAHAIGLEDALGWLVSIGVGHRADEVGSSLRWLGRVAYEGVRLTASGSIVPTVRVRPAARGQQVTAEMRWRPALVDGPTMTALAAAMPGTVAVLDRTTGRHATPRTR